MLWCDSKEFIHQLKMTKRRRQGKRSFYCKALFINTQAPSVQHCHPTALAASAFVQVEESSQVFIAAKYHFGKTSPQSSCISETSFRLWVIILGKKEKKTAEITFSPPFFLSSIYLPSSSDFRRSLQVSGTEVLALFSHWSGENLMVPLLGGGTPMSSL